MKYFVYLILFTLFMGLTACNAAPVPIDPKYNAMISNGTFPTGQAERGKTLFNSRIIGKQATAGCIVCHSAEAGVTIIGPSQVGIATLAEQALHAPDYKGKATTVEGYFWESMLFPTAYVTPGYPDVMYRDYGKNLTEQDMADLVAYLATLK
jgi:cytochrome c553